MWVLGLVVIIILAALFSKPSKESKQDDSYFFGNGKAITDKDIMFAEMMEDDDD